MSNTPISRREIRTAARKAKQMMTSMRLSP